MADQSALKRLRKVSNYRMKDSVDEADWKTRGFFMTSKAYSP